MKQKRKSKSPFADGLKLKGFARLQITENGEVVGDSGWKQNLITDNGYLHYLAGLLGNSNVSKQVSRACLGTGSTPAAGDTGLAGEYNTATYTRTTVTYAAISTKTARFTFTFASANSHITASTTLGNVGLINNTTSAGSLMCGVGFATSQFNTNQDVQATYEIRFA